jgi:hypothetical protein
MCDPFDRFLDEEERFMSENEELSESEVDEDADPSVPTELLDLHVQLEEADVTPEAFKEVYGE